ncbi:MULTISPECIES: thiamine phosphate synthase [unclassified Roseitalea]|uniref:thiamine phosphate synthase n=1 Tax=unclassified Roseitalea TaxID=2639107 RepID=UPI00273D4110|nr:MULTISPECIES: thiamine phosphate synthase [unclassified Roseitalea]
MTTEATQLHCRLVLVTPKGAAPEALAAQIAQAGQGGDVASIIVPQYALGGDGYQGLLETVVPAGQRIGAAVMAAGEPRMAMRTGADGVHLRGGVGEIVAAIADLADDDRLIGADGGTSRHTALEIGEARPDYVFFGRLGGDTHAMAHPKAADLARWWADFVEIPAVLMGGFDLDHLDAAAGTGVDFVALSQAVFGPGVDTAAAVAKANAILREHSLEDAA